MHFNGIIEKIKIGATNTMFCHKITTAMIWVCLGQVLRANPFVSRLHTIFTSGKQGKTKQLQLSVHFL